VFRHALLQDAAHETLLRSRRRELDVRIAAVLEEHFPEAAERQPWLLAHHYTEAGSISKQSTIGAKPAGNPPLAPR